MTQHFSLTFFLFFDFAT